MRNREWAASRAAQRRARHALQPRSHGGAAVRGRGGCGGQESISCDLCVFVKADGVQYKTRVVPRVFVLPIARRAHNATIRELKSYAEVQKNRPRRPRTCVTSNLRGAIRRHADLHVPRPRRNRRVRRRTGGAACAHSQGSAAAIAGEAAGAAVVHEGGSEQDAVAAAKKGVREAGGSAEAEA